MYAFGALDPTRFIFQSYIEISKPIGPVLKLHYPDQGDMDSPELLLRYLRDNEQLLTDERLAQGKIVFLMDGDDIVNLGITNRDLELLTVLDNDKPRTFSLEEIHGYYERELTVAAQK